MSQYLYFAEFSPRAGHSFFQKRFVGRRHKKIKKMDLQLSGKKVFISGSTQGIGFAIAQQLLAEGAELIINGRNADKAAIAEEQLKNQFPKGRISTEVADFSVREDVKRLLTRLTDIDILINNVGIYEIQEFADIDDNNWYRYFEINVMSSVRLCRHMLPQMLKKRQGRIIFISSESGVNIPANMIHYGMTKAALAAIANGLSKLTKGSAVTVNTVLGGPTYSDGVATTIEQMAKVQNLDVENLKAAIISQTNPHMLLERFIEPREIASLVTYLASPLSAATNGATLRADAGVLRII